MHLIRKKLKDFSAAHRLIKGYKGQCAHLHGHNYATTILIGTHQLDQFDMVIDFNEIKALCDFWLQNHVDHATIISSDDQPLINFTVAEQQKYYIIPDGKNTSAEVLAEHFFNIFEKLLKASYPELILFEVEVAESMTSQALFRKP
jgi:6-pyruvoyltetrahydropterin/6-carboxytetrahydropterin synthase